MEPKRGWYLYERVGFALTNPERLVRVPEFWWVEPYRGDHDTGFVIVAQSLPDLMRACEGRVFPSEESAESAGRQLFGTEPSKAVTVP